jgi:hypothetical protein
MKRRYVRGTVADRFWHYVEKGAGCWLWRGARRADGRGMLNVRHPRPRPILAHRIGYEVQRGSIPTGMQVCHTCDNPSCVRGDHLFLGTNADNRADMKAKGRGANQNTRKKHCVRGHALQDDNLYVAPNGYRTCVECRRLRQRLSWQLTG